MTSPTKLSIKRRIRTLKLVIHQHGIGAETLVGTVLNIWCNITFPALPKPSLPFSKALSYHADVIEFVSVLRQMEFFEATYWLSSAYAMLAEENYRKKLAMFFTPVPLTEGLLDDLAEQGTNYASQTFMDPACGGAAFLAPIAQRMRLALSTQGIKPLNLLKHIEAHIHGTDLDKTLCELSKHFLCMVLHTEIQQTGYVPKFKIYQGNSLIELDTYLGTIDVVVCNPPYRKMKTDELKPLRSTYSDIIEAQPNLYCLFITLCVRLLRNGGRAALVTPTSFLSGQYFRRLRKFLIRNADIEHIGMVSDRLGVFIGVEQETALTVMRQRTEEDRTQQAQANVSVVSGTGQYKAVGECLLPDAGTAWPIPRSIEDVALVKTASLSRFRLSDYGYRARIGAYVWNRDKRPKFKSLQDARLAGANSAIPLLWSRDITTAGIIQLESPSVYKNKYRFVDIGNKPCTSVIKSPCVVMQRVTSNDQPRRLVAATVPPSVFATYGGFIGENHVVIIEQIIDKPTLSPTMLARLLSTNVVDRYFRCISGATNVSVFELNQLALPDPTALQSAMLNGSTLEEAVNRTYNVAFEIQTDWAKESIL